MHEFFKIDSLPKFLSLALGLLSLYLLAYGLSQEPYWAGLGLILLMTSLMVIFSVSNERKSPLR